jgi:hypothetical protein
MGGSMKSRISLLSCGLIASCLTGGPSFAQIQGRTPTFGTTIPETPETAQQKREKSNACNAEAAKGNLNRSDRTAYLKFCNSAHYYPDFKAPTIETWRSFPH